MHSKTMLKICGLTTEKEIEMINELDVDYIGFVFAKSKREVGIERAISLKRKLKAGVKIVGVFVSCDYNYISSIDEKVDLDVIQLHGKQDNDLCKKFSKEVWKSISIDDKESLNKVNDFKDVDLVLFDTYKKGVEGGSGESFNWDLLEGIDYNYALAGGLDGSNIASAIAKLHPYIVDLSSGAEGDDGKKSKVKLEEIVRSVKNDIRK